MTLVDKKDKLTTKDIRPFLGKSELMQEAYLENYEPKDAKPLFPAHSVNMGFVGMWTCLNNKGVTGKTSIYIKNDKFYMGNFAFKEIAPYFMAGDPNNKATVHPEQDPNQEMFNISFDKKKMVFLAFDTHGTCIKS